MKQMLFLITRFLLLESETGNASPLSDVCHDHTESISLYFLRNRF